MAPETQVWNRATQPNLVQRDAEWAKGGGARCPPATATRNRKSWSPERARHVAPPQDRPRRAHALCARPAPLHPGTRRSRHFAGHSLALAAAILRWCLALGEPRIPRRRPPAATRPGLSPPLAAGGADSTPGPPWDHPRPGACRRCPASSVRLQAARRPGPWSRCRQGPHH